MAVERAAGGTSLIDVLDRVLDKGIVIDAWVRVSLVGIDLITVEARVVVASIDTYLKYSEAVGQVAPVSRPRRSCRRTRTSWPRTRRCARSSRRRRAAAQPLVAAVQAKSAVRRRPSRANHTWHVSPRRWRRCGHRVRSEARARRVPADEHRRPGVGAPRRRLARGARPRDRRPPSLVVGGDGSNEMLLVAEHGVSSGAIMDFVAEPRRRGHPLIQALDRVGRSTSTAPRRTFRSPLEAHGFHAIPLRVRSERARAHGLLLVSGARARSSITDASGSAGLLGKQVSRLLGRQTARGDALRPGADAALQHHQRRHRPDPPDRHRRQADHREQPRGEAVRGARGSERGLAARRRAEQHALLRGALDERGRPTSSWRGASCCWSIRSKAPTCCSSCSARAPRTSARAPTSSRSCATSPTWRAPRKRSRRATGRCASRRRKCATSGTGST